MASLHSFCLIWAWRTLASNDWSVDVGPPTPLPLSSRHPSVGLIQKSGLMTHMGLLWRCPKALSGSQFVYLHHKSPTLSTGQLSLQKDQYPSMNFMLSCADAKTDATVTQTEPFDSWKVAKLWNYSQTNRWQIVSYLFSFPAFLLECTLLQIKLTTNNTFAIV